MTVVEVADEQSWELHFSEISQCALIVDAIFGTGLKSAAAGMMETVIADVNASEIPIVSVDLPSGLSADTPHLIGDCIDASMTVTLAAPKLPLVLPPGEAYAGDVVIADIGIPYEVIDGLEGTHIELLTPEQLRSSVGPRAADSHKGDFGRLTIVAGSVGKTGAAHLAAMGALRSGAGLVTVATPRSCLPMVAGSSPVFMTLELPDGSHGTLDASGVETLLEQAHDVIACGPGLGRTPEVAQFIRALLDKATVPLVLDADALTVLADDPACLTGSEERELIITPHPGEMARLVGVSVAEVQSNRIQVATRFRDDPSCLRHSQGSSHGDRDSRGPRVSESHRQSRHGNRRHGRRADRNDCRVACSIARCGGRMSACGVPSRSGRRPGRGQSRDRSV